jgi:hypothetical protein
MHAIGGQVNSGPYMMLLNPGKRKRFFITDNLDDDAMSKSWLFIFRGTI